MSTPPFEEIVKAWVLEYDERLPTDRRDRREAFIVLLGNLNDHGYGKEEFNTSRKEKIVRSCVNPNHKDKNRLKRWISMVVNDLDSAILIYYGTVKIRRDVVTSEMAAKLESMERKAEQTRSHKKTDNTEENVTQEDPDKPLNLEEEPFKMEFSYTKPITDAKITIVADEELDQMKGPEAEWDQDLINELGIKLYE